MVGSVVDKGACDDMVLSHSEPPFNSSVGEDSGVQNISTEHPMNSTNTGTKDMIAAEVLACKVGMATAVTFIAGVYQVL